MFFEIIFYIKESGRYYNFNWKKEVSDFDVLTLDPIGNFEFDDNFLKELLNKEKIENFIEN